APNVTAACTHEGVECEYGASKEEFCGDVYQCSSGTWSAEVGYCGTPDITGNLCPDASTAVQVGNTCPQIVQCDYKNARCSCSNENHPDATTHWNCTTTPPGCPAQRPLLGMSCAPEGTTCDYGVCNVEDTTFASPLAVACKGGIWTRMLWADF